MIYETVIGLEVHAELSTKSKIFCACSAHFGGEINTNCCPICTGMPGSLPVLNKQVVNYALKMALATNCNINKLSKSDRKNYFYPDLPKAYQISQDAIPICQAGLVYYYLDGEKKSVRLNRIHFEEDAGKLLHEETEGTIIDFNRCGVPLIEMVTEPDLRSSSEAKEFLETIKTTLSYLDICDCKMEEGSIRCDINVSLREKGTKEYGTRVEMKNVNTFSGAVRAIEFEVKRQTEILNAGGTISQETRRWDDVKLKNTVLRTKEDAHDYRYFPDPDLAGVEISDEWIKEARESLPELPISRYERYTKQFGMKHLEAWQIVESFEKSNFLDDAVAMGKVSPKSIINWILSDISKYLNEKNTTIGETMLTAEKIVELIELIEKGEISSNAGKKVLLALFQEDTAASVIVEKMGLKQVSDESAISKIIDEVLMQNEQSVLDYKSGNKNAIGFLVGKCMQASKGQGNPQIINKILAEKLV